jgi:hypothetical protein
VKSAILVSLLLLIPSGIVAAASGDGNESEPASGAESNAFRRLWTDLRASGAVRFDYFRSSRDLDDEKDFFGTTTQIKLLPSLGSALDSKLEARLTNPDVGDGGETQLKLLEGYLTWHIGKVDVRAGRQIVPWGRADGINPTDNLTPRDFKILLPFEEDQRFGLWALKVDYALTSDYTFTAFATPWFEPAKVPGVNAATTERRPESSFANTEFALKFNKTGGAVDWSLSYFHGYSPLPSAHLLTIGENGPILELRYDKIDVVGADFARNYGRYGFRGELAYFFTSDDAGRDPFVKNPYLFLVLGGDRTFFDNLNINLQFVGRWVNNYTDPDDITDSVMRLVAQQNAIAGGQQDRFSYGLSSRVGKKWFNDTLEAEILVFADFTRLSSYVRPLITYAFTDHLKSTIGADLYYGENQTVFGQLKRNQNVFVEMRYSF